MGGLGSRALEWSHQPSLWMAQRRVSACTQRVAHASVGGPTETSDVTGRRRPHWRQDGLAKERARRAAAAASQIAKPRPLKVVIATTPHRGSDGPSLQRDIT